MTRGTMPIVVAIGLTPLVRWTSTSRHPSISPIRQIQTIPSLVKSPLDGLTMAIPSCQISLLVRPLGTASSSMCTSSSAASAGSTFQSLLSTPLATTLCTMMLRIFDSITPASTPSTELLTHWKCKFSVSTLSSATSDASQTTQQ